MRIKIIILIMLLLVLSSLNVLASVQPEDCYAKCRSSVVLEIPRDGEKCDQHGGIGGWDPFMLADCDRAYYDTGIQTRTCGSVDGLIGCYDCFVNGQPNPDLEEVCDGVDNDCDGLVDEGQACDECPPVAESGMPLTFVSPAAQEAMLKDFYAEPFNELNNQNQQSVRDSDRSYAENFVDYFLDEFKHNLQNPSDMLQTSFEHSEALGWTVGGLYYGGMALAAPAVAEVAAFYAPSLYYNPTVAATGTAVAGFIKGMYDPVIGGAPAGNAGRMLRTGPSRGVRGREFGGVFIGEGGIIEKCLTKLKNLRNKLRRGSLEELGETTAKTVRTKTTPRPFKRPTDLIDVKGWEEAITKSENIIGRGSFAKGVAWGYGPEGEIVLLPSQIKNIGQGATYIQGIVSGPELHQFIMQIRKFKVDPISGNIWIPEPDANILVFLLKKSGYY